MMTNFTISEIGSNARIKSIGSLFRPITGSRWSVNVSFWPRQEKPYLSISNAPILSRNRILNPKGESETKGWEQSFSIKNTSDWKERRIGECPIDGYDSKRDRNQLCFVFTINGGQLVYLPQFELARALFFHDGYLSRTSLEPKTLGLEFGIVDNGSGTFAEINVLPSSGYKLEHFKDPMCRQVLSWILLDGEARGSYESIGKQQLRLGREQGRYRLWDFSFVPPALPNARFQIRGHFEETKNCLFINKIEAIHNVRANLPDEIEFTHPDFTIPAQGQGLSGTFTPSPPPENVEIVDGEPAHLDAGRTIIKAQGVSIRFDKLFVTRKAKEKERPAAYGKLSGEETLPGRRPVSTEEPDVDGGYPSADWNTLKDTSAFSHLFNSKFQCFLTMLDTLEPRHGCEVLTRNVTRLPSVSSCRSNKHLLGGGSPRCIADALIHNRGTWLHLLEVDTSDAEKSLSTQLLRLEKPNHWATDLERIKFNLVKASLAWPTATLAQLCGPEGFTGINHPQTPSADKGVLSSDSVTGWAERVYGWMQKLSV
jgi:hypothetical protein